MNTASPVRPSRHPIDVLKKEAQTAEQVRKAMLFRFPKHVRIPGRARPIATGWESHQRPLVAK